ncbi:MAG: JAB domain-containing protein [Flavipsychrobacter sp.]
MSLEEIERIYTNLSEVELIYKPKVKMRDLPMITTAAEAYEVLRYNWNAGRIEMVEEFKVMFLNRANKAIGIYHVSIGGITGTVADPRLILIAALKMNAVSIIIAHNHPSGNLKPSRADEEITTKIKGAAAFLDIKVLDHLIITSEEYFSFADNGII